MRRCRDATINVAEGAVRAGKTVDNVFVFCTELETTPDKIHLATGSTAPNAKLNIGECNGLGIEYQYRGRCHWGKFKGNECLYVRTKTGTKIVIFAGGAKADSFKKIRGNSYGMWIATEINLHHDNTIKEAFNRQLAAINRKVFWDLNPDNPNALIYKDYIDKYRDMALAGNFPGGYNYEHFTIYDNETVTKERLNEILVQYTVGTVWHRRDILGERCTAEGLVYPFFDTIKHVVNYENIIVELTRELKKQNKKLFIEYYISVDYGTVNPFSTGLWAVIGGKAYRIKEYYFDSKIKRRQKTDEEYYSDIEALAADLIIQSIVVDPSAASFIETIRRHGKFTVRQADNSVLDGIRTTATMLSTGHLFIDESCADSKREFGMYSWDDDSGEDKPIKENDHAMDDIRYFTQTILRQQLRSEVNR